VLTLCGDALAGNFFSVGGENYALDFCSTQVNADAITHKMLAKA
jgi:hypothetical protein